MLIKQRTITFSRSDINKLSVEQLDYTLLVRLDVTAPKDSISAEQVKLVRHFLERELGKPINLRVRIIPIEEFRSEDKFSISPHHP